jgi:hypothetical protein
VQMNKFLRLLAVAASMAAISGAAMAAQKWVPDHIVIVIEENRSASQIYGSPDMPYLNALVARSAKMTNARFAQTPYGIVPHGWKRPLPSRPSQANYMYLFSGNNQGVLPNWFADPRSPYSGTADMDKDGNRLYRPRANVPVGIGNNLIPADMRPFSAPNMGAALLNTGRTFASFVESLPYPAFDDTQDSAPDNYRRKHNPVINWINMQDYILTPAQQRFLLPVTANLAFDNSEDPDTHEKFRGFVKDAEAKPLDYSMLPTVSIVIPNEQNDGHSNNNAAADAWLKTNIKPYADWAMAHNSLLIITYDEDGSTDDSLGDPNQTSLDKIVTIFYGPGVKKGSYDEPIDHLNVLSTVLDRYGLLPRFRLDFMSTYRGPEARHEYTNLRAIRDVFGEGPALH